MSELEVSEWEHKSWDSDWQDYGLCNGTSPELWFGLDDEYESRNARRNVPAVEQQRIAKAKAICRDCPVRFQCLRHASEHPEAYGIWGGTTRSERSAQRRSLFLMRPTYPR